MTSVEFKRKWSRYSGKESAAYQEPHRHAAQAVKPAREKNKTEKNCYP
jgi:hypothetical protein